MQICICMANNSEMRDKVNAYLELDTPYAGETQVIHYLELLRDQVGFDKIAEKVVKPLSGRKIGAYYGCMLLRPAGVMQFDDPENPTILEDFLQALGASPISFDMAKLPLADFKIDPKIPAEQEKVFNSAIWKQLSDSCLSCCA